MKTTIIFFWAAFFLISCSKEKRIVTSIEDYKRYLVTTRVVTNDPVKDEIEFWTKRLKTTKDDEASLIKLAGIHANLFRSTGLIDHISKSDSLYQRVLAQYPEGNTEIYHSLAANAITQHQFLLAKEYAEKALALNDKKAASLMVLVDVSLEIGDYARAKTILNGFRNKNSFAYLIREAKLKDHEGHLDSAIVRMEKAYSRIKGNKALSQWALSNLGDMYGHAGRIEEAYRLYLKVLADNPYDDYVLKGIAWIALSNDQNLAVSKDIIENLLMRKRMPEAHLMLAEIARLENDEIARLNQLKIFKSMVSQAGYKTMYHKYLAILEAEDFNNAEAAVEIANKEIANRPTPQSYDLLAWGYYHQKKFKQALDVVSHHIQEQTFEPESYYHMGMIYAANGYKEQARHYLIETLDSEFELGPSITKKIKVALRSL
jgi:tetratricopeptide (TPR) repeat protein